MPRFRYVVLLLALVLGLGTAVPSAAQELSLLARKPRFIASWTSSGTVVDASRVAVLMRRVTLDLDRVPLAAALQAIAESADLDLSYQAAVLPRAKRVSLHVRDITTAAALTELLLNSDLDVAVSREGRLTLVRAQPAEPRLEAQDSAQIVGRVTDVKTGEGLSGAEVVLEGTALRTSSGQDGHYRLGGVVAGDHRLTVRRIGYVKRTQAVAVSRDQTVTVDVALELAPTVLDQVVVTGTVVPTEVKALPTPVSVVTATDIERLGIAHLEQLFRGTIPGAVSPDQGMVDRYPHIFLRGGTSPDLNVVGAGQVKTLIDGVEVADFGSIAQIDPTMIERVEVIRGPQASTLYGSGAISGLIQVFTKRGQSGRPQVVGRAMAGTLQSRYGDGTALRQEYSLGLSGGAPDFTYRLGGSYLSNGDWLPQYFSHRASFSGGLHRVEGPVTVDLTAIYSDHRYHYQGFGPIVASRFESGAWSYGDLSVDRSIFLPEHRQNRSRQQTYGATIGYNATPWWRHQVVLGYDRVLETGRQSDPQLVTPADTLLSFYDSPTAKASYGYNTTLHGSLGAAVSGNLTLGFDHWRYSTSLQASQRARGETGYFSAIASDNAYGNTGYFAQAQVGVREALFLTAGVRAERNDNFGTAYRTATSPRFGVAYVHNAGPVMVKGRASYGRAIRAPEPFHRDAKIFASNYVQLANPLLRPEEQHGWDAGLELYFGNQVTLQATYYNQLVDGLIGSITVSDITDPVRQDQFQNLGQVRNRGVELSATVQLTPSLNVNGTYSIAHSTVEEPAPAVAGDGRGQYRVGDQLHQVPVYSGGLTVGYVGRRAHVSLGATYISSIQNYDDVAYYGSRFGGEAPRPTVRDYLMTYPTILKLNANLSYDLSSRLAALLRIDNLTNSQAFETSNIIPVYGRRTVAGLQFKL